MGGAAGFLQCIQKKQGRDVNYYANRHGYALAKAIEYVAFLKETKNISISAPSNFIYLTPKGAQNLHDYAKGKTVELAAPSNLDEVSQVDKSDEVDDESPNARHVKPRATFPSSGLTLSMLREMPDEEISVISKQFAKNKEEGITSIEKPTRPVKTPDLSRPLSVTLPSWAVGLTSGEKVLTGHLLSVGGASLSSLAAVIVSPAALTRAINSLTKKNILVRKGNFYSVQDPKVGGQDISDEMLDGVIKHFDGVWRTLHDAKEYLKIYGIENPTPVINRLISEKRLIESAENTITKPVEYERYELERLITEQALPATVSRLSNVLRTTTQKIREALSGSKLLYVEAGRYEDVVNVYGANMKRAGVSVKDPRTILKTYYETLTDDPVGNLKDKFGLAESYILDFISAYKLECASSSARTRKIFLENIRDWVPITPAIGWLLNVGGIKRAVDAEKFLEDLKNTNRILVSADGSHIVACCDDTFSTSTLSEKLLAQDELPSVMDVATENRISIALASKVIQQCADSSEYKGACTTPENTLLNYLEGRWCDFGEIQNLVFPQLTRTHIINMLEALGENLISHNGKYTAAREFSEEVACEVFYSMDSPTYVSVVEHTHFPVHAVKNFILRKNAQNLTEARSTELFLDYVGKQSPYMARAYAWVAYHCHLTPAGVETFIQNLEFDDKIECCRNSSRISLKAVVETPVVETPVVETPVVEPDEPQTVNMSTDNTDTASLEVNPIWVATLDILAKREKGSTAVILNEISDFLKKL